MSSTLTPEAAPRPVERHPHGRSRLRRRRPLPTWLRVSLIVVAVVLLAVGVAGLVLPGIQGVLTILAGLALLSLVSRPTHRLLRWSLQPWPKLRKRVERLRLRFRAWLHRKLDRWRGEGAAGVEAMDGAAAGDGAGGEPAASREAERAP